MAFEWRSGFAGFAFESAHRGRPATLWRDSGQASVINAGFNVFFVVRDSLYGIPNWEQAIHYVTHYADADVKGMAATTNSSLSRFAGVSVAGARKRGIFEVRRMAGTTRLELATSAVTGQRSNQLNYVPGSKTGIGGQCRTRTCDLLGVSETL